MQEVANELGFVGREIVEDDMNLLPGRTQRYHFATVFSVDEKTAIQALDRLDPVLPLSPGGAERHGFEYYRHGTLSLYAALDTETSRDFVVFLAVTQPKQGSPQRQPGRVANCLLLEG